MKEKLPKAFKKKWVAALRSGEYKQGSNRLYRPKNDTYCCLGVACVVSGNEPRFTSFIYNSSNENGKIPAALIGETELPERLATFNDGSTGVTKKSFNWIASYIERYL